MRLASASGSSVDVHHRRAGAVAGGGVPEARDLLAVGRRDAMHARGHEAVADRRPAPRPGRRRRRWWHRSAASTRTIEPGSVGVIAVTANADESGAQTTLIGDDGLEVDVRDVGAVDPVDREPVEAVEVVADDHHACRRARRSRRGRGRPPRPASSRCRRDRAGARRGTRARGRTSAPAPRRRPSSRRRGGRHARPGRSRPASRCRRPRTIAVELGCRLIIVTATAFSSWETSVPATYPPPS